MEFKIVRIVGLILVLILCFFTFSCTKDNTEDEFIDEPVTLNMNTEYKLAENLPDG
jgi:amino acid permease